MNSSTSAKKPIGLILRLTILLIVDGFLFWFGYKQALLGNYTLVTIIAVVGMFLSAVFLFNRAYPLRWMAPGLALMIMFSVYPNVLTIYVGFTNYGDGHLLTKDQAIAQIEKTLYLPEGGISYTWTAFKSEKGDYAIWLQDEDGTSYLAIEGQPITEGQPGKNGVGKLDKNGIPNTITGYERLNVLLAAADPNLPNIKFGDDEYAVQIQSPSRAAAYEQKYIYDPKQDAMLDQETGKLYHQVAGTFQTVDGKEIIPGYKAFIGFQNFKDFFVSPAMRGPLLRIITWNFIFPLVSVFLTFALGLAIAMLYNDPNFKGKRFIRSVLLIPYTIPSLITILIWRGMLNQEVGIVNRMLDSAFGIAPAWFADPWFARGALILVNLWLGYPYFMLICSGALQSIPEDIYGAAKVDGTNGWQSFRFITLPLLLVAIGPLLLASYVFNFNNFNLIYLFLQGGPPIAGAATRAGHTDIMISYVYNLAFEGGRGQSFGLASAVTLLIFIIVIIITLFQFRYTQMWEEVSENV